MKKLLMLLVLCGCAMETPNAIRPYYNGPVYYKQTSCSYSKRFPTKIRRWNNNLGIYEIYETYENTTALVCNEPTLNSLYGHL